MQHGNKVKYEYFQRSSPPKQSVHNSLQEDFQW